MVIIIEGDIMNKQVRAITVTTFSLLGILCIASGIGCLLKEKQVTKKTVLVIVQKKQINKEETIQIVPKELEITANTPLSIKVADYLQVAVTNEQLANLKLDTSTVDVTKAGVYTYTITYLNQVYQGHITVKENIQETAAIQSITLKTLNIKLNATLSQDVADYIVETVPDEVKALMKLDLSQVNIYKANTYQYTITYLNSVYTSNITVTEDKPPLSTATNDEQTSQEDNNNTPNTTEETSKEQENTQM